MARFSQLLPWLRVIFPPADAAAQLNPSEVSEDISLVCSVYHGTELMRPGSLNVVTATSVVGVEFVELIPAVPQLLTAVHFLDGGHNDATSRVIFFEISLGDFNTVIVITPRIFAVTNERLSPERTLILPPNTALVFRATAISVGNVVTAHAAFSRFEAGKPVQPF